MVIIMKTLRMMLSVFALVLLCFSVSALQPAQAAIRQCAHPKEDYVLIRVITKETCISKGAGLYKCLKCNYQETRDIIRSEHIPGDWRTVKAPTCKETGEEECLCSFCGEIVDVREIGMLPHNYGEWQITRNPTCKEEGVQNRICEECHGWCYAPILRPRRRQHQ